MASLPLERYLANMEFLNRFHFFTLLDGIAVAALVLAWLLIGLRIENPRASSPSVSILMAEYRREWMRQMITRQPRIFDATILDTLRQGTAFFASACLISIGGGLALIGNTERLLGVAQDLSLDTAPAVIWEVKILAVLVFVTNALLQFIWSHRLFGYCAVVMAATPNDPKDPLAIHRADQASDINIAAARAFTRGLRAMYFALGTLAWLLGPIPLLLATTLTVFVLWRREFNSTSHATLRRIPKSEA
jgi:uncharacterized membrane protein